MIQSHIFMLEPEWKFKSVDEESVTKVAETYNPASWSELKTKVNDLFHGKLDNQFERWETKMALDKTALASMFTQKATENK